MHTSSFYLRPKLPFRLDLIVWALRRMPHNIIDRWNGTTYSRVLSLTDRLVRIDMTQPREDRLRIEARTLSRPRTTKRASAAEYVMLRGLGRINVFPGDDTGAQKNLMFRLGLAARPDYWAVSRIIGPWRPYAGLVYFHLFLRKLRSKGLV